MAQDLKVTGCMCSTKPDYSLAWTLLDEIKAFYEDPENEKAFREWEKEYDARRKGARAWSEHWEKQRNAGDAARKSVLSRR